MGKKVLEKCLSHKPQPELPKCGFRYQLFSQHFPFDSCFSEKVTGKVNRPKTSANLTTETKKNLAPGLRCSRKPQ